MDCVLVKGVCEIEVCYGLIDQKLPTNRTLFSAEDVAGSNVAANSALVQTACNPSSTSQSWIMRYNGPSADGFLGYPDWSIRPAKATSLCVTVLGASPFSVGAQLTLTTCASSFGFGSAQLWYMLPGAVLPSSSTTSASSSSTSTLSSSSTSSTMSTASSSSKITSSTTTSTSANPSCTATYVRREWRELSQSQKDQYALGINRLKSMPSAGGGGSNLYEDFTMIHYKNAAFAHGTSLFFPWHRRFLVDFEKTLRSVLNDNTFCLP